MPGAEQKSGSKHGGEWRGALVLGPVDRVVPGVTQATQWLQDTGPVVGNTGAATWPGGKATEGLCEEASACS